MTHTTTRGVDVCEVIIVLDSDHPDTLGQKRYSNQDYWKKVKNRLRPLNASVKGWVDEYEDAIGFHKTGGES